MIFIIIEKTGTDLTRELRNFHNLYIKKKLIISVSKPGDTLIDLAVGKGGDIPKWISAKLKFVLGIDISRDNIENRIDGICVRYLHYKKRFTKIPQALFVQGNSTINIKNGDAILTDTGKQITKAIFGNGARDKKVLGEVPYKMFGEGENGFNICSIQFAMHYMWETAETLHGFLRNVSETTKINGYFIGTSYNGDAIFKMLALKKLNETVTIMDNEEKIWSVTKKYNRESFVPNSSSIGYGIDIYQESIHKTFREYLVNYIYLTQVMENYGFVPLQTSEAQRLGLSKSIGSFSDLFADMKIELKKNPRSRNNYGNALKMSAIERNISFLNNYFVYKKVRNVDAAAVSRQLLGQTLEEELTEKQETDRARDAVVATLISRSKTNETPSTSLKLKKKLKLKKSVGSKPVSVIATPANQSTTKQSKQ